MDGEGCVLEEKTRLPMISSCGTVGHAEVDIKELSLCTFIYIVYIAPVYGTDIG